MFKRTIMDHSKATQWKINICVNILNDVILHYYVGSSNRSKKRRRNILYEKSKKKSTLRKKEKRYYKHLEKDILSCFLCTSHPHSTMDKSVLPLITILQADDSFSSFTFDAFPFYLPRPISTYVRKPLRKQGHTNTYV